MAAPPSDVIQAGIRREDLQEEEYNDYEPSIESTTSDENLLAPEIDVYGTDDSIGPNWTARIPDLLSVGAYSSQEPSLGEERAHETQAIYGDPLRLQHAHDDFDGPRFRLLQLAPSGPQAGQVCGDLIVRHLFDSPPYTALSYAWGTGPRSQSILLGRRRRPFPVSAHLYAALERLRRVTEPVTVWVDAVCINQDNFVERATQVQIMAQIFGEAQQVSIWLGPHPQDAADGGSIPDRELFWQLCQQPNAWWRRLWILQECAYARTCPVVLLGNDEIPLAEFITRWEAVVEEFAGVPRPAAAVPGDKILTDQGRGAALNSDLEFIRMPYQAWKAQVDTNRHRMPLLQRLRETFGRECTVPHDRVYSLLSLVDETEVSQIVPDYRKPYDDVVTEVEAILASDPAWDSTIDSFLLGRDGDDPPGAPAGRRDPPRATAEENDPPVLTVQGDPPVLAEEDDPPGLTGLPAVITALQRRARAGIGSAVVSTQIGQQAESLPTTAVLEAVIGGDVSEVQAVFFKRGAGSGTQDGFGELALHYAAYKGNAEIVRVLLEHEANLNIWRDSKDRALAIALLLGYTKIAEMLLACGAKVNGGYHAGVAAT